MHEKLLSKTHFICPKKAALVTCSLSSLVFFFELFLSLALPFSPDFFFGYWNGLVLGCLAIKRSEGVMHRVFSHMCHSHMSLQPRCLMTNSLFQISSRIAVSTCFLLFYSIRVPWTETVTAFWHFSSTASNIFTTKKVRFICFALRKEFLFFLNGCPWPHVQFSRLSSTFLRPAEDKHYSPSSKHSSGKGCSIPPSLHFEFNQPIGMGHHMSQAPNLISHFLALRPCCWSGLDSSG